MFGGKKTEEVDLDGLSECINRTFNEGMLGLDRKARRILEQIERYREELESECGEFGRSAKEPDTEDLFILDSTFIKKDKEAYVRALRSILAASRITEEAENIYDTHAKSLSNAENLLAKIAELNKKFRFVLAAYSGELRKMKKKFAQIDGLSRPLRAELDARRMEYERYRELVADANELALTTMALKKAGEEAGKTGEAEAGAGSRANAIEAGRVGLEKAKEEEISIEGRLVGINAQINAIVAPLSRVAKKHDYMKLRGAKLSQYLERPVEMLSGEESFSIFAKEVNELKKEIEEGKIETKNKEYLYSLMKGMLEGRLKALVEEYKEVSKEKLKAAEEVARKELELSRAENEEKKFEAYESEKASAAKMVEELKLRREKERLWLEKKILSYFNRKVEIKVE